MQLDRETKTHVESYWTNQKVQINFNRANLRFMFLSKATDEEIGFKTKEFVNALLT